MTASFHVLRIHFHRLSYCSIYKPRYGNIGSTPLKICPILKHLFKTCSLLYLLPYWRLCSSIADISALYCHRSDNYLAHIDSEAWFRTSSSLCGQVIFRDHLFHFSVIMPPLLHINSLTIDAVESK